MSKKTKPLGPVPVNLPEDLRDKVEALKTKTGLSYQDIMRLAIERGIGTVEQMFEPPTKQAA